MATRLLAWLVPSKKNILRLVFLIGFMVLLKMYFEWKQSTAVSSSKHANVNREVELVPWRKNYISHNQTSGQRGSQQRMAKICDRLNLTSQNSKTSEELVRSLRNVLVVDDKKLLFCYVPKIACTNWKRILLILQGILTDNDTINHMEIHLLADAKLPTLSSFKVNDAIKKIQEYRKILFVREPFTRLLSAYRDKLEKSGRIDSDRFRKEWSSTMRGINKTGKQEYDVTFLEYVNYLADPSHPINQPKDEHWNPIFQLCKPCDVQYDFIGSMETLGTDTEYVLKHLLHTNLRANLHNSTNFTNSSSVDIVRQYYSQIPLQSVMQLYMKYRPDFALFDYPFPWFAVHNSSFRQGTSNL